MTEDDRDIPDNCDLCERHGHDDQNAPDRWIDVVTSDHETERFYVCERCAKETSFRTFTPLDDSAE